MDLPKPPSQYLFAYAFARSAVFSLEGLIGQAIELVLNRKKPRLPTDDRELFREARASLEKVLRQDIENIRSGLYPLEVLRPESPIRHLARFPRMFREGLEIAKRRREKNAKAFSEQASDLLSDVPDYYRRNFHFQADGYLSDESAELYDHQVEILFAGAAHAMRRLIIAPMKKHFQETGASLEGEGLTFLELGAGTGSATRFVRLAFPKAKIVAVDLSSPYLKKAQENLKNFARHDFVEADAAHLPFLDGRFDAVYSVFLFHELPLDERKNVIRESLRVLKHGAFFGLVDSLQKGDKPALDEALERFPVDFHEPFYRNYTLHPMEDLVRAELFKDLAIDFGFFSKVVSARKI
jgi:ubiquinone/menaquinone biosynthesis C-methylase UbiE